MTYLIRNLLNALHTLLYRQMHFYSHNKNIEAILLNCHKCQMQNSHKKILFTYVITEG